MRTFIDYLKKENILERTIEIYKNQITKSDKVLLEKIIKNLFSFQENFTKPSNFDILGTIYEKTFVSKILLRQKEKPVTLLKNRK